MDKSTKDRIAKLHPKVREEMKTIIDECNVALSGRSKIRISQGLRTFAEQDALFKQKPKVTNAKGGQSIHNYGLAFDIVILKDKDNNGTFETASFDMDEHWMNVVKFFKAKGWTWGGDWKSFKDGPHFEKTFGHTWQTLSKKEIMINNGLRYPII